MSSNLKIILAFLFISSFGECSKEYVPIVLWHGMGDVSEGRRAFGLIQKTLAEELPGVYVRSLRFGDSKLQDTLNGFLLNANTQVEMACEMVRTDPKLQNGFHAIGNSQGGQFLRALIQRCPEARVRTLITMGSQHQGVYGVPICPDSLFCDLARRGFTWLFYHSYVQPRLVQAQYWRDPRNLDQYLKHNTFLADINNEGLIKNSTYAKNLAKLDNFVMVRFKRDIIVRPIESSWFGFYAPGQATEIQSLNQTTLYKEDWLGLQTLDRRGALHFLEIDAGHVRTPMPWFKKNIINRYLK